MIGKLRHVGYNSPNLGQRLTRMDTLFGSVDHAHKPSASYSPISMLLAPKDGSPSDAANNDT